MNLATPNQFIVAMQTRIPQAQVLLDRNLERRTTAIAVEVPSLSRTATVSDFSSQGSVDPGERLAIAAVALAREIQQEAIDGYGLQPIIDAAREEGIVAVRAHLDWLQEQIERAEEELEPFPESSSARTALIGRIQGMRLSRRMLAMHAGIVLEERT